jgi:hypothetical protein
MSEKMTAADLAGSVHTDLKQEMETIAGSLKLFEKLAPEARQRAYTYLGNVLRLPTTIAAAPAAKDRGSGSNKSIEHPTASVGNISYASLAELYNAARPETGAQKVLVGGYWCQVCEGLQEFSAQLVNDQLKEIGAKVANVTVAFNTLKASNPGLVLQIRKSGKSQQARKQYKLTIAGIRAVEEMIQREG